MTEQNVCPDCGYGHIDNGDGTSTTMMRQSAYLFGQCCETCGVKFGWEAEKAGVDIYADVREAGRKMAREVNQRALDIILSGETKSENDKAGFCKLPEVEQSHVDECCSVQWSLHLDSCCRGLCDRLNGDCLAEHPGFFRNPVVVTRYSDGSFSVSHANSAWDEIPYSEGWVRYCGPRKSELMMIEDSGCPLGIKIGYLYLDEGII